MLLYGWISTITFVKAIFAIPFAIANFFFGIAVLDQTRILTSSDITLSGKYGLRDFEIVRENKELL